MNAARDVPYGGNDFLSTRPDDDGGIYGSYK